MRKLGRIIIPIVFIIRAIGEFHYVGFFKQIKDTDFGQMDTLLFSPLCLVIGLMGFAILFMNPADTEKL